jgi:hypothetical protein
MVSLEYSGSLRFVLPRINGSSEACIRQHTSAYEIRAYVSIRQYTRFVFPRVNGSSEACIRQHTSAYEIRVPESQCLI